MKVLIVEDESLAADKLERMLARIDPGIEVLAKPGSIREAVKWLSGNTADLIFLDIRLSDGISFSIFDEVNVQTPVIFTTAYDQYAIRAFQVNSIAYLLKPIRPADLEQALKKFGQLKSAYSIDFDTLLAQIRGEKPEYKMRFLVQIGEKIRKVEVPDIAYFFVLERGVFIKTFPGASLPVDYTLDGLSELLDPAVFFRINRKYLINMASITGMVAWSRGRVKLELQPKPHDEFDAVVSIDRAADFRKWMGG
jgi:two-component system, LytTR family, response regulator LytT